MAWELIDEAAVVVPDAGANDADSVVFLKDWIIWVSADLKQEDSTESANNDIFKEELLPIILFSVEEFDLEKKSNVGVHNF